VREAFTEETVSAAFGGLPRRIPAIATSAGRPGGSRPGPARVIGHNTLIVLLGCAALGLAAGVVGSFALLRGRALLADAIGHAALPGWWARALIVAWLGGEARALGPLLLGAAVSATLGLLALRRLTASGRIRPDADRGRAVELLRAGRRRPLGGAGHARRGAGGAVAVHPRPGGDAERG
jgi:hypothetical protein